MILPRYLLKELINKAIIRGMAIKVIPQHYGNIFFVNFDKVG
jgi:hypothetical protein